MHAAASRIVEIVTSRVVSEFEFLALSEFTLSTVSDFTLKPRRIQDADLHSTVSPINRGSSDSEAKNKSAAAEAAALGVCRRHSLEGQLGGNLQLARAIEAVVGSADGAELA